MVILTVAIENDDYLGEAMYVDLPSEVDEALRTHIGVNPEYFQVIAYDPPRPQMKILGDELETLCIEIVKKNRTKAARSRRKPSGKRKRSDGKSYGIAAVTLNRKVA